MKITTTLAVAVGLASLAACNQSPKEEAADNIEANAEMTADNLEEAADNATNEAVNNIENTADRQPAGGEQSDAAATGRCRRQQRRPRQLSPHCKLGRAPVRDWRPFLFRGVSRSASCLDQGAGWHQAGRVSMAKGQKKSNREVRKPKADKGKKQNASNPSVKPGVVRGLDNFKS